jgi:hypothetical protein
MVIRMLCLTILLLISYCSTAQKTEDDDYAGTPSVEKPVPQKIPFNERLVFGGNFGGFFGPVSYLQINPMVGVKMNKWWINGVGLNYIYTGGSGVRQHVYGASVWSRAYAFKSVFVHTEYERLLRTASDQFGNNYRANVPVWLVGAGYQDNAGRLGLSILVLYDLIQDPNSPYSMPIFRIGGLIGF